MIDHLGSLTAMVWGKRRRRRARAILGVNLPYTIPCKLNSLCNHLSTIKISSDITDWYKLARGTECGTDAVLNLCLSNAALSVSDLP